MCGRHVPKAQRLGTSIYPKWGDASGWGSQVEGQMGRFANMGSSDDQEEEEFPGSLLCQRIMGCLSGVMDKDKNGRRVKSEGRKPDSLPGCKVGWFSFVCLGEHSFW